MHIKNIHSMIEKLSECAKVELDKGVENIDTKEMGEVAEIIKELSEAEYYAKISKAMDEAENEDNMRAIEMYEDYPERRYYDNYRYKTSGRFAPKGKGSYMPRRGYDEPPYYHMNPDMYREHTPEYYRDVDRAQGKMYYTDPITTESRYDKAKRGYEESKMAHKENTPESKQAKMKDLEMYLKELSEDVTQLLSDATPEERSMVKNKMQVLTQKIS